MGFKSFGLQPKIQPPFLGWPASVIGIIEDAIRVSAPLIESALGGRAAVLGANENSLTNALQKILCDVLDDGSIVDGFSTKVFQTPTRDASVENFSGNNINKKPDLTFYRTGSARLLDGWFCECKILDKSHKKYDYLYDGILRFIDGTYAWANPHAQMIGYVREPSFTLNDLTKYLETKPSKGQPTHGEALLLNGAPQLSSGDVLTTEHSRNFVLETVEGMPSPGAIELRHLWLTL